MQLLTRIGLLAVAATLLLSSALHAGAPPSPYSSPDVVIATVRNVDDAQATRGNPPKVELEITDVLRGQYKAGETTTAIWNHPPHDIDTTGREAELKKWNETPMKGPKVGEKFILFGWRVVKDKQVSYSVRTEANSPMTDENKAKAIKIVDGANREVREEQERRAAEAARTAEDLRKWRESITPDRLAKMARDADLIAVGQIEGEVYSTQPLIYLRPDKVLKQPDGVGKLRTLIFPVSKELILMLDRKATYVLFIKWPGKGGVPGQWEVQPASGEGIAVGDEKTLAVVEGVVVRKK